MHMLPTLLPTLFTERLILTPLGFHPNDAADMHRFLNNYTSHHKASAGYNRHQSWTQLDLTLSMAKERRMIQAGSSCSWAIRLKEDPERLIGDICYHTETGDGRYERGFSLDADYHGQGIMTEAAIATLNHMFSSGMTSMLSANDVSNIASSRIKYKTGAVLLEYYLRDDRANSVVRTAERWELTREQWGKHPDCALTTPHQPRLPFLGAAAYVAEVVVEEGTWKQPELPLIGQQPQDQQLRRQRKSRSAMAQATA